MATQQNIKYEAPEASLPAPLPTTAEILTSEKFYTRTKSGDFTVRVGTHYVAKYGQDHIHLQEGDNMLFIKQNTTIPVPTVYKVYEEDGTNFLVMEYVPGKTLKEVWPELPFIGKQTFTRQIRRYIQDLRALPSPGYYGGIYEQGVQCPSLTYKLITERPIHPLAKKPSRTEADWCDMMIKTAEAQWPNERAHYTEWVRDKFRSIFSKGHEPKFTHCDMVNRCDLILRADGVIVPIDWAHAGWYPSYWEYCLATQWPHHRDDWAEWIADIFKDMEYVPELGWMIYFRKRMFDAASLPGLW